MERVLLIIVNGQFSRYQEVPFGTTYTEAKAEVVDNFEKRGFDLNDMTITYLEYDIDEEGFLYADHELVAHMGDYVGGYINCENTFYGTF